jgi:Protein of unknown function (DUF2914)
VRRPTYSLRVDLRTGVSLAVLTAAAVAGSATVSWAQDEEPSAPVEVSVARAVITSGVVDREPKDELKIVSTDVDRVYCWTDVRGASGQTLVHAWIHEGSTKARVGIRARADRWRCYSSKQLLPSWTGEWQVKVFTEDGRVLATAEFTVQ